MEPKNPLAKHLRGHPAKDVAAAFEWLRDLATADGAPPEAGIALDVWHSVTEAVRTAPPAEPAPIDKALRDIDMAACYGTEEDPDAAPEMLRTIGEIARKALAEIDSAQAEPKSRTEPAKPNDSEALVAELEGAVARAAGLHATHIGRVMSDDDYATFVRLRDEKIPRLRAALRLVLAAPPPSAPQPAVEARIDPMQNPLRPTLAKLGPSGEHPAEEVLRKLACWLGVGGYNAPTVDAELFHRKIVDGIQSMRAAPPQPADAEYEIRHDGQRVRRDRWELGFRRIVSIVVGNRADFDIDAIVARVADKFDRRDAAPPQPAEPSDAELEAAEVAFLCAGGLNGNTKHGLRAALVAAMGVRK